MPERTRLSFEFFPPRTGDGRRKLRETWEQLREFEPAFCSVTYGAGGSTLQGTRDTVLALQNSGIPAAAHLSFSDAERERALELLDCYRQAGVRCIVALRGDAPLGVPDPGETANISGRRHAVDMVRLVREHSGDHFHIEVAAYPEVHPEAENWRQDIDFLKQKFAAGADSAITQFFYNADAWFYFRDACVRAGIEQPLRPGLMPIIDAERLLVFADKCGAEVPRWLRQRLVLYAEDPAGLRDFGIDLLCGLGARLLDGGAPGLHFYTLNQAQPSASIWRRLRR